MRYTVEFFNTKVQDEILNWPHGVAASFTRIAEQMVVSGPNLGMPYTKPLGDGLFEVRAKGTEGIGRAFFCTVMGQRIIILHGFIKKSQQIPIAEMKTARQRLKEIHHGNK